MFERLLIQNFQTHEKLRVDLDPAITSIVGPSDVGKSAIIRALRWVCTNQPNGDAFVRYGSKGTTVQLVLDGGFVIARRRSSNGTVNEYKLDEQEFVSFKTAVPEPIEQLLNLGTVSWQGQHDQSFWFSNTPGEVSRQLNAIVDLGIIDETLAGVARVLNKARTKLEVAEENLTKAKKERDSFAWVPDFVADLTEVNAKEAAFNEKVARTASGTLLLQNIVKYQSAHEKATEAASRGQVLVKTGEKALELQKRAKKLQDLIELVQQREKAAAVVVPSIDEAEKAFSEYSALTKRGATLRRLIESINSKGSEICKLEEELSEAENAIPKTCPTCGRSL